MDPLLFNQKFLPSGAAAVWRDQPHVEYMVIGVVLRVGSMHDPVKKMGLAHLFEHIPFEGTTEYSSNKEVSRTIESRGGFSNAATGADRIIFAIGIPAWYGHVAWHVLEQMLFYPRLTQEVLESQVVDIINEMAASKNMFPSPSNVHRMNRHLFGPQFATKARTIGIPSTLSTVTLSDIQNFHRRHFRPANMTFLAFGNLSAFGAWDEFLNDRLRHCIPELPTSWTDCPLSSASQTGTWTTLRHDEPSPRLVIAARIHHQSDETMPDFLRVRHGASLLNHILTEGQSSVLYQQVREKSPLSYDPASQISLLTKKASFWEFHATTETRTNAEHLIKVLQAAMTDTSTFTDELVDEGKQAIHDEWAMQDYTPKAMFEWAAQFVGDQPIPTKEEQREGMKTISPAFVREMLLRDFHPDRWITMKYYPIG